MSEIDRTAERSLTAQIGAAFEAAIGSGELEAGEKLPPTRELAELAGVNHLTAARAYRHLAELGLVTSKVGSGTFVRGSAAAAVPRPGAGEAQRELEAWQHYALPAVEESYADSVLADMFATAADPGLIPLMAGYPSEKLFPAERLGEIAAEVMADEGPRALQYDRVEGTVELREQLAALGEAEGMADGPERIVVTTGARQGLALAARAILRPGDVVACESPSFAGVIDSLRVVGARVMPVPVDDDGLDVDALAQLLRRHEIRALAIQPRLHNPTGRDLSAARREQLAELARRHGFFVLEDAVYSSLRFEGEDHGALRALAPEHVVYVKSISKTITSGLRVGWVAASGPVLERIAREKRNDDVHSPTLTQLVAARFLAEGGFEKQVDRAIDFHRQRRAALLEAIRDRLGGIAAPAFSPLGGGHVWVALERPIDERALYAEAVRHDVNFMPAGASMPERPRGSFMRLSFSYLDPEELREGVRRLAVAIRAVRRAGPRATALPVA